MFLYCKLFDICGIISICSRLFFLNLKKMKTKFRINYKKSAFWIGIVIFGAILVFSLQFARAWVNPDQAAPNSSITSSVSSSETHNQSSCVWVDGGCVYASHWVYGSSQALCSDGKYVARVENTLCGMGNNSNDYSATVYIRARAYCCSF